MYLYLLTNKFKTIGLSFIYSLLIITIASFSASDRGTDSNAGTSGLLEYTKVPAEVQQYVNNYLNDSMCDFGLNYLRSYNSRIDSSITIADLVADTPLREFVLDGKKVVGTNTFSSVSKFVIPSNYWRVAIRAKGKLLYFLMVKRDSVDNFVKTAGSEQPISSIVETISSFWPEQSGFIPISLNFGLYRYYHFPQIDDCNMLPLNKFSTETDTLIPEEEISKPHTSLVVTGLNIKKASRFCGVYLSHCQWGLNRQKTFIADMKK